MEKPVLWILDLKAAPLGPGKSKVYSRESLNICPRMHAHILTLYGNMHVRLNAWPLSVYFYLIQKNNYKPINQSFKVPSV